MNDAEDIRMIAERMREEFDHSFAVAEPSIGQRPDDYISIRIGDRPFALRVPELASLRPAGTIVPLPGADPWLLGLVSHRGKPCAVFSLRMVLNLPSGDDRPGWIAFTRDDSLGLAFDGLDGYSRVDQSELIQTDDARQPALLAGDALRSVIDLAEALQTIHGRMASQPASGPRSAL